MRHVLKKRAYSALFFAWLFVLTGLSFTSYKSYAQVPEGFEDLVEEQSTLVDIFFGGVYLTTALATFDTEVLRFESPEEIVESIASITNKELLVDKLRGDLQTNAALICYTPGQQDCGILDTEDVGIIFNDTTFRADLFINSRLQALKGVNDTKFLGPSDSSFSHLSNVSLSVSGSDDEGASYAFFGQSIASLQEHRLRSLYSFSKNRDESARFLMENLFWEYDQQDREYRAGLFPSNVQELTLIPNNDIAGVRYASTTKTRTDLASARGLPIQIFLQNRSRVEISREGRLISARFYEAGNQLLDTSTLPEGAYDITIRINDITDREEIITRFFVKTPRIPPRDQNLFFIEAGEVLDLGDQEGLPGSAGSATLRGGYSARVTDSAGYQIGVAAVEAEAVIESGIFYIHPAFQTDAKILLSSEGDLGLGLNSFFRAKDLSGGISLQAIESDNHLSEDDDYRLVEGKRTFISSSLNYPFYKGQLTLQSSLVQRAEESSETIHALSWFRNFRRHRYGQWTSTFQLSKSPDEFSTSLQFTWRMDAGRFNHSLSSGIRQTKFERETGTVSGQPDGFSPRAAYLGSWNDGALYDAEVQSNLAITLEKDRQDILFANEYRNQRGRADISIGTQRVDGFGSSSSYSLNLGTSIIGEEGYVGYGGDEAAESAVLLDIDGTADRGVFDIFINDRFHSKASVGSKVVVPLLAYHSYDVDLRDSGEDFISFDGRKERVTLYPGNVKRVSFRADNLYVLIGRVVKFDQACDVENIDGAAIDRCWIPFTDARTRDTGVSLRTDDVGFIQLEVTGDKQSLEFEKGEENCTVAIPFELAEASLIYAEDDLHCFTASQENLKTNMAERRSRKETTIDNMTTQDQLMPIGDTDTKTTQPAPSMVAGDSSAMTDEKTSDGITTVDSPSSDTALSIDEQNSDQPLSDNCRRIQTVESVGRKGQLIQSTIIECDEDLDRP